MRIETYYGLVQKQHESRTVRLYFLSYAWLWFHTQFWLSPLERRPYTFIFRDWIYPHLPAFLAILAGWYSGLLILNHWHGYLALILGILSSLIVAHLVWGGGWKPGQQEEPTYLGE